MDTDKFRPRDKLQARSILGLPQNQKILLFTCQSHAENRKGFKSLIEIAELLSHKRKDLHIMTFGTSSEELEKLHIPVTALGHVSEGQRLALGYSAADVTILPSLEDNYPNVILESVACGTPVAAYDAGGISDAVKNGITGYVVEKEDYMALANTCEDLIDGDYSESCREYAIKHYSQELQASRYINYL